MSPQHRILVSAKEAQLLFGTHEVLVPAQHLVDGTRVLWDVSGKGVTYIHVLFSQHEIIDGDGCASESFHPGPVGLATLDDTSLAEVAELFPELTDGIIPFKLAQTELKRKEAHLLRSARDVTVRPVVHRQKKVQHHRAGKRV